MSNREAPRTDALEALLDTYPHCGCRPEDCPDREGVEAATSES